MSRASRSASASALRTAAASSWRLRPGLGRELEFPDQAPRAGVRSSWLASATKARCLARARCSRPSSSFIVPARAAISSPVGGTSTARRLPAPGYRGYLPPQPLNRGEGGAGQPVGAQARDGDENGCPR